MADNRRDGATETREMPPPSAFALWLAKQKASLRKTSDMFTLAALLLLCVLAVDNWEHHGIEALMGIGIAAVLMIFCMMVIEDIKDKHERVKGAYAFGTAAALWLFLPTVWLLFGFFAFMKITLPLALLWFCLVGEFVLKPGRAVFTAALVFSTVLGTLILWTVPQGSWTVARDGTYTQHEQAVLFGMWSKDQRSYFYLRDNGTVNFTNLPEHWRGSGTFTITADSRDNPEAWQLLHRLGADTDKPVLTEVIPDTISFAPEQVPDGDIRTWLAQTHPHFDFTVSLSYTPPAPAPAEIPAEPTEAPEATATSREE